MTVVVDSSALSPFSSGSWTQPQLCRCDDPHTVGDLHISVVTRVEAANRPRGSPGASEAVRPILQTLLRDRLSIKEQSADAAQADWRCGPGDGSAKVVIRPKLNFGDCFSYALAASLNARLLFKGDDFRQTDVAAVLA